MDDVISDLNGDPLTLSSQPIFVRASLGSNKGILRQGETATYNASFIITQQAIDAGGVSNTVTVVASGPGKTNDIFDISDDGDDTMETPKTTRQRGQQRPPHHLHPLH